MIRKPIFTVSDMEISLLQLQLRGIEGYNKSLNYLRIHLRYSI